ncbi:cytochrome c3 family protein [Geomonas nitrogeniifigens]|uniref:Cytochrome c3 family protein n=1 Tax=Geomonas diazotrophica TaxID=2843197 RepID=A0ABX8JK23_9BACT|nr:cytochrome c3 family protein [Geomonas nitrogeniifigens]QWV95820.1 cytochrome c3 family protein [Geomonas nitrogeniifigens]
MKKLLTITLGLAMLTLVTPFDVGAIDGPHVDPSNVTNTACTSCHNQDIPSNSTVFNNSCLSCHTDFSTGTNSATQQTSHKWTGNVATPTAGAQSPTTGALTLVQNYTGFQLACVSCHNPHDDSNGKYKRIANDNDQLCLDCHRSRDVKSQRVVPGSYPASHPVNVTYSDAVAANPAGYNSPPVNANPSNPNSDLNSRLSASGGVVLCSTCHSVHSAYSQSANPPVADSNGKLGDGNLLRTDTRGAKVAGGAADTLNICTNCHKDKFNHNAKGQDVQCLDCHAAHVEYDPNDPNNTKGTNINLIRRNLPGTSKQIFYRYAGDNREYKNADGTGICQGCHALPNTIADHASNDPKVCNNCHTHNDAKGSFTAAMPDHKATLGSGDIVMFTSDSTHDVTPLSISENCTLCHYESLLQQHGSKCSLCHGGTNPPRNSFNGAWDKTCSAGTCHPAIHVKMTADHNGMYWNSSASCDLCHDTSGGYPGPGDNCARCHNPDMTVAAVGDTLPPVTTSNAVATYAAGVTANIHLTAIDQGTSGISVTRYSLDGRAWRIGTDIGIAPPSSGSKTHTLQFYSTDHAMNVETAQQVSFVVQAVAVPDTTPPTTTSSFNPTVNAIFKASQAVTLSATDAGSGVKSTYFKIDSGTFTAGTSFAVSGDGLHTFSYYSVDNANNTETTHVSNQFRIDTTAPVTTSTAVAGTTYSGNQTFTLSATDSGSGVASTWYKLDAAAFTSGTSIAVAAPVSGSVSHTIQWYSIDNAGNQEVTKSVAITVQAPVSDTVAPVTTSSFNPTVNAVFKASQAVTLSATDAGSGVKSTYFKIDSGTFTAGTSFTVSGDGLHTFSYYSVDNANNTETTHVSNQFRIDTTAPVTTSTAVAGTTYSGNQTFTLSATDSGSGVASTWYKLDAAAFTSGTSIAVAAPVSGSVSHTIQWYSIDNAGNQEVTKSVTITVQAQSGSGGTTTLVGQNNSSSNHPYTHFWVNDASDTNLIADGGWSSDEHITGSTFVVPSGVGYVMHVEWEYPDYEGGGTGSDLRTVTPSEASSGATVTWQLNLP